MARRNITNERYTAQADRKTGKTRKSASSIKPRKEAAGSVYIVTKKKNKAERRAIKQKKEEENRRIEATLNKEHKNITTNAKIKRYRKYWWICLVLAIAGMMVFLIFAEQLPREATTVVLVLSYAFVIAASIIEFGFTRRERKRLNTQFTQDKNAKKIYKDVQRRVRAEMRAEENREKTKAVQKNVEEANAPLLVKLKNNFKKEFGVENKEQH